MNTQIFRYLGKNALVVSLFLLQANITPVFSISVPVAQFRAATNSGLTATRLSPTSVRLNWDGWDGAGSYTVRVKRLSDGAIVQQYSTPK